tara:strand:+ start:141 stop:902 length:762 start_codon:yes stop_codon:yes gene_type:complete
MHTTKKKYKIGLIGKYLNHSFSKNYFDKKKEEKLIFNFSYDLYEISSIDQIEKLFKQNNLIGLNITYPYKENILKFINSLDEVAKEIRSVNTIFIDKKTSKISGYNTDWYGFDKSLNNFLKTMNLKALVLGNGGASKAICYCLRKRQIPYTIVSRNPKKNMISYDESELFIKDYKLIINTTVLGSGLYSNKFPKINYNLISDHHFVYDLAYNPTETLFLKKSKKMGAKIKNGYDMLKIQADKSLELWRNKLKL